MTPRSKHITMKYHFFKQYIQCSNGDIKIAKDASENQLADCMTKGFDKVMFQQVLKLLAG